MTRREQGGKIKKRVILTNPTPLRSLYPFFFHAKKKSPRALPSTEPVGGWRTYLLLKAIRTRGQITNRMVGNVYDNQNPTYFSAYTVSFYVNKLLNRGHSKDEKNWKHIGKPCTRATRRRRRPSRVTKSAIKRAKNVPIEIWPTREPTLTNM